MSLEGGLIRVFLSLFVTALSACSLSGGLSPSLDIEKIGAPNELGGFDYFNVSADLLSTLESFEPPFRYGKKVYKPDEVIERGAINGEYTVGAGDVLSIIVWDHPELTSPTGDFRDPASSGRLVSPQGTIFYPYVGELDVAGLPVGTIRRLIAARLARVVRDPQVDVRVVSFRSKKVTVSGAVNQPAVIPLTDRPLSVIEALSVVGGLSDDASRRSALLKRGDEFYLVKLKSDLQGELWGGRVLLEDGDELYVESATEQSAYVLGAANEQQAIPLRDGVKPLAEILSEAGGLKNPSSRPSGVYVIRSSGHKDGFEHTRPTIYRINLARMDGLILAQNFEVWPRDIVYVDRTGLSEFSSVVSQVLPLVSTVFQLDRLFVSE